MQGDTQGQKIAKIGIAMIAVFFMFLLTWRSIENTLSSTSVTLPVQTVRLPTFRPPTLEESIASQLSTGVGQKVSYDKASKELHLTYPLGSGSSDNTSRITRMHVQTFVYMKSIYTSNLKRDINTVTLTFTCGLVHTYANISDGVCGIVTLRRDTQNPFQWETLTQESAWPLYSSTWILRN